MMSGIDMLREPPSKADLYFFRPHESVREQETRPYRPLTFLKITIDMITLITLFCNMLQLTLAAVTIDLASVASGVDCNIGNHFFADEFRPLDVDISKYLCMRNKAK